MFTLESIREGVPWTYLLGALLVLVVLRESQTRRRRLHLPPGPTPLPFIGNALDMPRKHLGAEFHALTQKYGDIVYLNALGQRMLILGSYQAARDLLDKRSANYSDRPPAVMGELTGLDCMFSVTNYGNKWRLYRRAFHQSFNAEAVHQYEPVQIATARELAAALFRAKPCEVAEIVKFSFASSLMRVAYGIDLARGRDGPEYFTMIERIASVGEAISVPGRFAVEALPALRHVPEWAPGAGFRRYAAEARAFLHQTLDRLYGAAVEGIKSGVGKDSFVSRLLEDSSSYDLKAGGEETLEGFIKNLAIMIYSAGADTTYSSMQAFLLAMAKYPAVLRRAQQELDRVVGSDRLPDFGDQAALPYLSALLRELKRWHVVTPISVPHRAVADDEYAGYYVPAGTIVTVNVWALARDPQLYPDPDTFSPERFLDAEGNLDVSKGDPSDWAFGFGRRICPGRYFADASLFILTATLLHAFEILPPKGMSADQLVLNASGMGVVSHTAVYDYVVKPRTARMEQLVLEAQQHNSA